MSDSGPAPVTPPLSTFKTGQRSDKEQPSTVTLTGSGGMAEWGRSDQDQAPMDLSDTYSWTKCDNAKKTSGQALQFFVYI